MEGWLVASKRLGALPKAKRGVLGRAWGRKGGGALPLPRAAVISTRLRVLGLDAIERQAALAVDPAAVLGHVARKVRPEYRALAEPTEGVDERR